MDTITKNIEIIDGNLLKMHPAKWECEVKGKDKAIELLSKNEAFV